MHGLAWLRAMSAEPEPMGILCGDCQTFWIRVGRELYIGYGRKFSAAEIAQVMNKCDLFLNGFATYKCLMGAEANATGFFHTSRSFSNEPMEKIQKFMLATFWKRFRV